jgi:hypothetical protein
MYMFTAVFVYLGEKDLERYTVETHASKSELEFGPSPDPSIAPSDGVNMYSGGNTHSRSLIGTHLELHLDGAERFRRETMRSLFN